jgi:hypothetical protein
MTMAQVKAKRAVYLGSQGYRAEGEVFDYEGPEHKHLEYLDKKEEAKGKGEDGLYDDFTREELKAELAERDIDFAPNAQDKKLISLLEEDDDKKKGS